MTVATAPMMYTAFASWVIAEKMKNWKQSQITAPRQTQSFVWREQDPSSLPGSARSGCGPWFHSLADIAGGRVTRALATAHWSHRATAPEAAEGQDRSKS